MKRLASALLLLAGPCMAGLASAQTSMPGGPINDRLGDMDYGVCRGTDPACYHDWPRPETTKYRILVYSRTGVSRHANLGPVLAPGMNPPLTEENIAQGEMVRIAGEQGWEIDWTEDVTQMGRLSGYNAVIFLSTSRDALDDAGMTALRQYMRAGGGFVAIHNAFGTLYNWPYYEGLLGGANFYDHQPHRAGDVVILDRQDASTQGLPERFAFKDEWYNLVPFPTRVRFLAIVDEQSWPAPASPPANGQEGSFMVPAGVQRQLPSVVGRHPGHGSFHPVTWCQYYDGGKAWVTTLGHDAEAFRKDSALQGAASFQQMLIGGIQSVMGQKPFCH